MNLEIVVKDAAKGIESGVSEVFPQAEQRDDCFHALYELSKVRRRLEQRAYGAIAAEEEARHPLPKIPLSDGKRRRRQRHKIGRVHRHCQEVIACYDTFEAALQEVQEALKCVDLNEGHLRGAEEVKAMVEHAADTLQGLDPSVTRSHGICVIASLDYRWPRGELNTRLHELAMTYSLGAVALACILWRLVLIYVSSTR